MPTARTKVPPTEADLRRWKLIEAFQERLAAVSGPQPEGTFADPRRRKRQADYLSLLLFGLFNPARPLPAPLIPLRRLGGRFDARLVRGFRLAPRAAAGLRIG